MTSNTTSRCYIECYCCFKSIHKRLVWNSLWLVWIFSSLFLLVFQFLLDFMFSCVLMSSWRNRQRILIQKKIERVFFVGILILSLNSSCEIQISRLYNTLTHLTFQCYFHLTFDRFYKIQLSHINSEGYREIGHIRLISCQWPIHINLTFSRVNGFRNHRNFIIYEIVKCLNKWNVHITNILNSWNVEKDFDQKF